GLAIAASATDPADEDGQVHGIDRVKRFAGNVHGVWELSRIGRDSYSPRDWGFWSQYGGPSLTLGTVSMDRGALRPGRHPCPSQVAGLFAPLLALAQRDDAGYNDVAALNTLGIGLSEDSGPDETPLAGLFTAT